MGNWRGKGLPGKWEGKNRAGRIVSNTTDLSLFNLPTETKQWMLAAKNSGKWFRRVEEAASSTYLIRGSLGA